MKDRIIYWIAEYGLLNAIPVIHVVSLIITFPSSNWGKFGFQVTEYLLLVI